MNSRTYTLLHSDFIPERDTENDCPEWFEDAASDADWADSISNIYCNTECISNSHTGILDELSNKNKVLERTCKDVEKQLQIAQVQNQTLTLQLANERQQCNRYEKKLEYIQSHQELFHHLKNAYLNMKYNESSGRKMIEIKEMGCQTWNITDICSACENSVAIANTKRESFDVIDTANLITVKRDDLTKLQETVTALKKLIDARELSYDLSAKREHRYIAEIENLKTRLGILNEYITKKHNDAELQNMQFGDDSKENIHEENSLLRTIILRMEKQRRENEPITTPTKRIPLFSAHEMILVQQLKNRYARKLQRRRRSISCKSRCNVLSQEPSLKSFLTVENVPLDIKPYGDGEKTTPAKVRKSRFRDKENKERLRKL